MAEAWRDVRVRRLEDLQQRVQEALEQKTGKSYQGLSAAANDARRLGFIPSQLAKKAVYMDQATHVSRHLTAAKYQFMCRCFDVAIDAEEGNACIASEPESEDSSCELFAAQSVVATTHNKECTSSPGLEDDVKAKSQDKGKHFDTEANNTTDNDSESKGSPEASEPEREVCIPRGGSSDFAEFFNIFDEVRDSSTQTTTTILPEASPLVLCSTASHVFNVAWEQVVIEVADCLHSLQCRAQEIPDEVASCSSSSLSVPDPASPSSSSLSVPDPDAFDDPTTICFQVRRLVHAVDCAMYDTAERSADDDGNFDLFMALPRRFLTRYVNHGAVESSEISSYLDAPWGNAAWGRLRTFDPSGCDVTEALNRYGL